MPISAKFAKYFETKLYFLPMNMKNISYSLTAKSRSGIVLVKEADDMIEISMKVDGMQCGMCESHVNDAVRKSAKVKKVASSHVANSTVVVAEDDVDVNVIKQGIEKEGYVVSDVEVKPYKKKGFFASLFKR